MSLNLLEKLTTEDRKTISQYIYKYGIEKHGFIGLDAWLSNWAAAKPHLYHLLGGKMIYEFPFSCEKPHRVFVQEIHDLLRCTFISVLETRLYQISKDLPTYDERRPFTQLTYDEIYINNALDLTLKYRKDEATKILQLQNGMKPFKALQKVVDYFGWDDLKDDLEDLRIKHSMILNDKKISGTACISIHPLDFITMSDNNSNWSSCMSWIASGCYHVGTVEMMNSNNVLCCYIKSSKDWEFADGYKWNDKKWRQLFYVTNDIAVCGKAYPYQNKDFSLLFLNKIKELSEKNLGRSYSFGPERYQDMKHIGSKYRMDLTRSRIARGDTFKHNIIFDTKGMYNDFFNAHDDPDMYWCYRNKVKRTKIVCISGKAPCLCCGGSTISEDYIEENYEGAYNDRFTDVDSPICLTCKDDRRCDNCGYEDGKRDVFQFGDMQLCSECAKSEIKKCPDCGEAFLPLRDWKKKLVARLEDTTLTVQNCSFHADDRKQDVIAPLNLCRFCMDKKRGHFQKIHVDVDQSKQHYYWERGYDIWTSKEIIPREDVEKYRYDNLETVDLTVKN